MGNHQRIMWIDRGGVINHTPTRLCCRDIMYHVRRTIGQTKLQKPTGFGMKPCLRPLNLLRRSLTRAVINQQRAIMIDRGATQRLYTLRHTLLCLLSQRALMCIRPDAHRYPCLFRDGFNFSSVFFARHLWEMEVERDRTCLRINTTLIEIGSFTQMRTDDALNP